MINRRNLNRLLAAGMIAGSASTPIFANAPTQKRLIFINLKGALDGLHALIPYADPNYRKLRPTLALQKPGMEGGVIDLDGSFGLHPALQSLHDLYRQNELILIPAISSQYRQRSHFEAQNMLEGGGKLPYQEKSGWLNRAIRQMGISPNRIGLSIGATLPLILQGSADIRTWSDSRIPEANPEFLSQINALYDGDPLLHKAFSQANQDKNNSMQNKNMRVNNKRLISSTRAALAILKEKAGPRIAVIEAGGWDTHYAQERRLSQLFDDLGQSISLIKTELGPVWKDTVVMVVSEFGRTAAENGSKGTDHGTGGLAIIAGGRVNGGKVRGAWPGLSSKALFEDRDLAPANRLESVFKSTLIEHLGLSESKVADFVFPNLGSLSMMENLYQ